MPLSKRHISQETCEKFRYGITDGGLQAATYTDSRGVPSCLKLRTPDKDFRWIGRSKHSKPLLFGQHLWKTGGKRVVVTEGEIDALTVAQAFGLSWPVVSVRDGASSAKKDIKEHLDWLSSYELVVLWFDDDEPGRKATEECATLLPVGKVKVAAHVSECKDANDVLKEHGSAAVCKAVYEARDWRPDGILSGRDVTVKRIRSDLSGAKGALLPYAALHERLHGLRKREVTTITAGSGIGKSTFVKEIALCLMEQGLKVGDIALEESVGMTALTYGAMHVNRSRVDVIEALGDTPDETLEAWLNDTVWRDSRWFCYDHFGSLDSANLLNRIRFLAVSCAVDFIVLDHISIATSGMESSREGERKDIDILMTRLKSISQETGVGIVVVCHLKRPPNGKSFNEGHQVSLCDLRGSGSLEQLSDNVVALERDQQDDAGGANDVLFRVLKCRLTGYTGLAGGARYNTITGRLVDASDVRTVTRQDNGGRNDDSY